MIKQESIGIFDSKAWKSELSQSYCLLLCTFLTLGTFFAGCLVEAHGENITLEAKFVVGNEDKDSSKWWYTASLLSGERICIGKPGYSGNIGTVVDELYIYGRVLSLKEIQKQFQRMVGQK